MSQLLTVMLIGRQAFLILMVMEAKRLQSVSHDIPPAGKSPLLEKSAFLRNLSPRVLFVRTPGQRCTVRWDRAEWIHHLSVASAAKNREAFWTLINAVGQLRPGTGLVRAERYKRQGLSPKEGLTSPENPGLHVWSSSVMSKAGQC